MPLDLFIYIVIPVLCFVVIMAVWWTISIRQSRQEAERVEAERVKAVRQPFTKKVTLYEVDIVFHDLRHQRLTAVRTLDDSSLFFCVHLHSGETQWIDKRDVSRVWLKEQGFIYE